MKIFFCPFYTKEMHCFVDITNFYIYHFIGCFLWGNLHRISQPFHYEIIWIWSYFLLIPKNHKWVKRAKLGCKYGLAIISIYVKSDDFFLAILFINYSFYIKDLFVYTLSLKFYLYQARPRIYFISFHSKNKNVGGAWKKFGGKYKKLN